MRPFVLLTVGLLALSARPGHALTLYTDLATWTAATGGDLHGPYVGSLTRTDQVFTATAKGGCSFTNSGPVPVVTPSGFISISATMFFAGDCSDPVDFQEHAPLEVDVHFARPIDGFFGKLLVGYNDITMNGIPLLYRGGIASPWGVVGPISDLAIVNTAGPTDNPDSFDFTDIVVATSAPEPSAFVLLGAGLLGLGLVRRWR